MTIPFSSITEGDRARKEYGDLTGLRESIQKVGQIQPIVLSKNSDETFTLVAGGRRYRCMKDLGCKEVHHGSDGTLAPGRFSYVFKDEVPRDQLKEAELDENLYRLKPKWTEDVLLVADVHAAKREAEGHKWGMRQTAALLGAGYGRSNVNLAILVAKLIRANDTQILQCATMSDAVSVMFKRKEEEALAEVHRRAAMNAGRSTESFLDTINMGIGKTATTAKTKDLIAAIQQDPLVESPVVDSFDPAAEVVIPLSRMFLCCDSLLAMSEMPPLSIDHVVTDIPYGIDMKNLDTTKNVSDVEAEHGVEQNVSMMEPFLAQAYRITKSGGFCVFFYDLDWHDYLQSTAESIGWKVQRWPYIACKTSACQNNAAQYNTTKNYEVCMFLRKDEKTVLRKAITSSWKPYDFYAERALYNNPFAKPFTLWKDIYDAVAFAGQTVLDPFCGEMSACRAAVNCGLVPFGMEIKESHFLRGLEHVKAVYALLHKSNVRFE